MPFSHKRIRSGYLVALALLLLSYLIVFYNTFELKKQSRWITHTLLLINKLDVVNRQVTEAETSSRGYIITTNDSSLRLYRSALVTIPKELNNIDEMVSDNGSQQLRLDTLRSLINQRLEILALGIRMFRDSNFKVTRQMLDKRAESSRKMDSVRLYIQKMTDAENNLMTIRSNRFSDFLGNTRMATAISLLIALIAIVYSFILYTKENAAKRRAYETAIRYEKKLEENIKNLESINKELKELRGIEKFASTGRVARTIAHEVRNPLTNISLAAEQLKELEHSRPEAPMLLEMISRNSVRINQLVADLLNATRFVQLDMERVEINKLIDDVLTMAIDRINLNHVTVEKSYSKLPVYVLADVPKMHIALLNIIINAVEAMEGQKGILKIRTRKENAKCIIEIEDNGIGMNEETMQSLFEPFFTNKPNGNGLGLTNSQNIILSHKGNIMVNSDHGKGTIFKIVLETA